MKYAYFLSTLVRCRKLSVQSKLLYFVEYEKRKGNSFVFSGDPKNSENEVYEKCSKIAEAVVERKQVDKPPELFEHQIIAFSYFFERAAESGLIGTVCGLLLTSFHLSFHILLLNCIFKLL